MIAALLMIGRDHAASPAARQATQFSGEWNESVRAEVCYYT
jgi:hypothetical protein